METELVVSAHAIGWQPCHSWANEMSEKSG